MGRQCQLWFQGQHQVHEDSRGRISSSSARQRLLWGNTHPQARLPALLGVRVAAADLLHLLADTR